MKQRALKSIEVISTVSANGMPEALTIGDELPDLLDVSNAFSEVNEKTDNSISDTNKRVAC